MKRTLCGLVALAAATALWSCNGDPTTDIEGTNPRVVSDPSSVFLGQGESKFVELQILDEQGNQQVVDFSAQNIGPGITVELDTTFLQTTIGDYLETAQRFIVTGTAPTSTSFEVVSGGLSATIPVKVTPTGTTVTLSNAAPAMNEPLTVTLPAGYKFGTAPGVTVGSDVGVTTAVAPDSSSVTVILPPGATGTVQVDSVQVDFLPGVNLSLPSDQTVTVGATPLPGTDAPTTAPSIPLPAAGGVTATFDVPDFAASVDHFYRIDVVEPGDYTITVDWDIGSDLDAPVCLSDPTCASEDFADPTVSGSHPETGTFTLPAGTHVIWVNDYLADAAGATISIVIERE
jgi:hypothetical protein